MNEYKFLTINGVEMKETGEDRYEAARKLYNKGIKIVAWLD